MGLDDLRAAHAGADRKARPVLQPVEGRYLPRRAAPGAVMPQEDGAVPLVHRPDLEPEVGLTGLAAEGDVGVPSLAVPLPAVPGADDVVALDAASDPEVGAEAGPIGYGSIEDDVRPPPQDDLTPKLMGQLN